MILFMVTVESVEHEVFTFSRGGGGRSRKQAKSTEKSDLIVVK